MVSTTQLIYGAAALGAVYYVTVLNPQAIPNAISQIQTTIQNLIPQSQVSGTSSASGALNLTSPSTSQSPTGVPSQLTPASILGVPSQALITPSLAQQEGNILIPAQQNVFCDPSFGLYWDPLQGRCVQQLRGTGGNCSQGSIFNHCLCQCVPIGIPQPQCYRDCTTSCPDKINQKWNWCVKGCVPKSYLGPDCPPQ